MGYALWTDGQMALAQGKHEYRPYGQAFVAMSDLFLERTFRRGRQEVPEGFRFVGYFASLPDVNRGMLRLRESGKKGVVRGRVKSQFAG